MNIDDLVDDGNEREEVIAEIGEWIKTLRSIEETLENPLATDYQMETVRQAVKGLLITHLSRYKKLLGL